jgi:hypothetical protein
VRDGRTVELGQPAPSTAMNATDTIWQFFGPNHR